jgi:GT2 family glycosyltransferase
MTPEPAISVVIPTCGRPNLLRRCLDALMKQTLRLDAFEIIVVDDGRSDATRQVVAEMARQFIAPVIRYIQPPAGSKGPAGARNAGWRAAQTPVIAFTDDDTIADARWLEEGLLAMAEGVSPFSDAAWGHVVVPLPPVPTDNEKNTKGLEGAVFVTANAFVKRAALAKVGGFDERYKRAWREDTDLYFALLKEGFRVTSAPHAIVAHPAREAPWGVSMMQQANAAFEALLYKKYPDLYRSFVKPGTPWSYYTVVLSTLMALIASVMGNPGGALLLIGLALATIGRLAWRRLRGTSPKPSHVAEMIVTSFALPFLSVYWRLRGAWQYKVFFL